MLQQNWTPPGLHEWGQLGRLKGHHSLQVSSETVEPTSVFAVAVAVVAVAAAAAGGDAVFAAAADADDVFAAAAAAADQMQTRRRKMRMEKRRQRRHYSFHAHLPRPVGAHHQIACKKFRKEPQKKVITFIANNCIAPKNRK